MKHLLAILFLPLSLLAQPSVMHLDMEPPDAACCTSGDYVEGGVTYIDTTVNNVGSHTYGIVTSPAVDTQALRLRQPGDKSLVTVDGGVFSRREWNFAGSWPHETDLWWSFDVYIETDHQNTQGYGTVLSQLKTSNGYGFHMAVYFDDDASTNGPIKLTRRYMEGDGSSGRLVGDVTYDSETDGYPTLAELDRGQWYNIMVNAMTSDSGDGYFNIYLDGTQVDTNENLTISDINGTRNIRFGQYGRREVADRHVVFDNVRFGYTRTDVDPDFGGDPTPELVGYYVDFETGDDSNSGTSRETPWKYSPGMGPFSGTYTPAPGDQIIFKGGVVWTNGIYLDGYNGTASSNIVFRSTADWYSGSSYSRPVLDMQGLNVPQGLSPHATSQGNVVWTSSSSYVTIADLEIRNWIWDNPTPANDADGWAVFFLSSSYNTVSNVYAHSWLTRTLYDKKHGGFGGLLSGPEGVLGHTAINNRVEGPNVLLDAGASEYITDTTGCVVRGFCTSGSGTLGIAYVYNNEFSGLTQGFWSTVEAINNYVHDACDSYQGTPVEGGAHENGTWQNGSTLFIGNRFKNIWSGVGSYFYPGWSGATGTTLLAANNIWESVPQINIIEEGQPVDSGNAVFFLNNTIKRSTVAINITSTKSGAPFGSLTFRNNLLISDAYSSASSTNSFVTIPDPTALGDNYTNSNNGYFSTTEAAAFGATSETIWKPTSTWAALEETGINYADLFTTDFIGAARPAMGDWDIGAYQLTGAPAGQAPPDAPTAIEAVNIGSTSISMQWDYAANDHTGFRIYQATAIGGPYSAAGTSAAASTEFTATGLNPATVYYFFVRSYNSYGESPSSEIMSAETNPIVAGPGQSPGFSGGTKGHNRRR